MKKRTKTTITLGIILAAVIAILIHNKLQMAARTKPDVLSALPVSVAKVAKSDLSESLTLVGTIVANNDVAIVAETKGKVVGVYAHVGDHKPAGSILIQVDDELRKATYASAEVNYEKAKRDLDRYDALFKEQATTNAQIENARLAFKAAEAQFVNARRAYEDTRIKTPISGIVTSRLVDIGTMIGENMVVANVVDISKLKAKVNVAERDAFKMSPGDPVEITTDVYPGVTFSGKIQTISAKADEAHTYPVEIVLSNSKDHPLRAGMFGKITFVAMEKNASLAIPREALVGSLKKPQVFVVEASMAHLRDVVVGSQVGTYLMVLGGLKEGETIVVNGQNNLKDSAVVSIINAI
jgi:RND family efflux transporter MFP subunit